jgi:hypothetical protein
MGEARRDALVHAVAGPPVRDLRRNGGQGVARLGVRPWRAESFRISTDPELVAKVVDVVGLYLCPPENAIVLSVDEKSLIQALGRSAPILPMQPGLAERRSHDYVRHGTSTLFAALEISTGKETAARPSASPVSSIW